MQNEETYLKQQQLYFEYVIQNFAQLSKLLYNKTPVTLENNERHVLQSNSKQTMCW